MNTYTLEYGAVQLGYDYNQLLLATTIGALLQLVTIPLFGLLGQPHRLIPGRAHRRDRHAARRVPDLLPAPERELRRAGRHDDHRRNPADDELGGSRRPAVGAVRGRFRYAAISFAYAVAAIISGFVPAITLASARRPGTRGGIPAIVLAVDVGHHRAVGFLRAQALEPIDAI